MRHEPTAGQNSATRTGRAPTIKNRLFRATPIPYPLRIVGTSENLGDSLIVARVIYRKNTSHRAPPRSIFETRLLHNRYCRGFQMPKRVASEIFRRELSVGRRFGRYSQPLCGAIEH